MAPGRDGRHASYLICLAPAVVILLQKVLLVRRNHFPAR